MTSDRLPPKREVALVLVQSAASVYVHLDPRHPGVRVPTWFKTQPQLVLQVGLNMAVPIVDLDIGEEAMSCTLSFNRRPEYCVLPWDAVFGLVDDDGRGMIWPESVPPEVAAAAEGRANAAKSDKGSPAAKGKSAARGGLRLATASEGSSSEGSTTTPAESEGTASKAAASKAAAPHAAPPKTTAPRGVEAADEPEPPTEQHPELPPPAQAPSGPSAAGEGRKLPPYLRIVK